MVVLATPQGAPPTPHVRAPSLIVVSNRLPFEVQKEGGRTGFVRAPGGLVTALDAVLAERGGVWVGWPGIESEQDGDTPSPPADGLRYVAVPLSAREIAQYYGGFSNRTLWPLCHYFITRIRIDAATWVFSKIMAWVALDRGATIAERHNLSGDIEGWRREAERVRAEVLERGVDPRRQAFVQVYGEPQLDAALLIVPKVRFLERGDPRVKGTLEAIRRELATSCEDLIFRYRAPDGLTGEEGAFVFTSFLMIQNVALTKGLEDADRLFRNLLRRASPLGLFAEEIDPSTGEQMGNFPQALSHAAPINTAVILERLRAGSPPAPQAARVGMI